MGTTVGITGHSSGFGKHISYRLLELGYTVKGFSRSNGYNLLHNPELIFEIPFDFLINNAEVGNAQLVLAANCARKEISCINIGSKITEAYVTDVDDIIKKDNKLALENFSKENNQTYLTWGFLEGHYLLNKNPHLLETITISDAVEDVINELE